MFLPNHLLLWSNQLCRIQRWFGPNAVSNNTDSELALYPTALIRNQRCIRQRWIFTFEYEYLHEFKTEFENILECESGAHMGSIHEKKTVIKNLVLLSLLIYDLLRQELYFIEFCNRETL